MSILGDASKDVYRDGWLDVQLKLFVAARCSEHDVVPILADAAELVRVLAFSDLVHV